MKLINMLKYFKNYFQNIKNDAFVLMLHTIDDNSKLGTALTKERFLKLISSFDTFISIDDAIDNGAKGIILTFDDAYRDVFEFAFPLLKKNKIPFVVFVVTDWIGKDGYITKQQLLEISKCDFATIGAHGITHNTLCDMGIAMQKEEIVNSGNVISDIIERKVNLFAYPHGQYNSETDEVLKNENRYQYAFDASGGGIKYKKYYDKYHFPRMRFDNKTFNQNYKILTKVFRKKSDDLR